MSDEKTKQHFFEIRRIYIKDISFEAPNTPDIFNVNWKPTVQFNLNISSKKIEKSMFEIVLKVKVIVKIKEVLVFLCDVDQAGIFFISNLTKTNLNHCLYSYCPNILFPYARTCISSLISYGSFPQMNLAPINFDAIYYKNIQLKKNNIKIDD